MVSDACRSCGEKKFFGTKAKAIKFASSLGYGGMSAYKCFYCTGWHLTKHKRPKPSPRLRAFRREEEEAWCLSTTHHNPGTVACDISDQS